MTSTSGLTTPQEKNSRWSRTFLNLKMVHLDVFDILNVKMVHLDVFNILNIKNI